VQELKVVLAEHSPHEFLIEPITPIGEPISLREAVLPIYRKTIKECCPLEMSCPLNAGEVCPSYRECRILEPDLTGKKRLQEQVFKLHALAIAKS
jgi:hypothetical protein